MKLDVISEKHNPLLARKEIMATAFHPEESTPSKAAVQQLVSKQLGVEAVKIDIRNIFSKIGSAKSDVKIFVWDNKTVDDLSKPKAEETKQAAEAPKPPQNN